MQQYLLLGFLLLRGISFLFSLHNSSLLFGTCSWCTVTIFPPKVLSTWQHGRLRTSWHDQPSSVLCHLPTGPHHHLPSCSVWLSDVQKHIQMNTVPPPSSQSRGGYTGPLMTDLRKNEGVTQVAQQGLAMLEQNIPQIRQHFAPLPGIASVATGTVTSSSLVSSPCVTAALQSGPIASVIPPQPAPPVLMSAHPAFNAR